MQFVWLSLQSTDILPFALLIVPDKSTPVPPHILVPLRQSHLISEHFQDVEFVVNVCWQSVAEQLNWGTSFSHTRLKLLYW